MILKRRIAFTKDNFTWKNRYAITFNANGGSGGTSKVYSYGDSVSFPTPSRAHYNFNGWYTASSGGTKVTSATCTGNVTYYAQWTQIRYTIAFDANGGSGSTSRTYAYGETISFPSTSRSGYNFNGWYTASSGGTRVTSATCTGNATYYAQWTAANFLTYRIGHRFARYDSGYAVYDVTVDKGYSNGSYFTNQSQIYFKSAWNTHNQSKTEYAGHLTIILDNNTSWFTVRCSLPCKSSDNLVSETSYSANTDIYYNGAQTEQYVYVYHYLRTSQAV